MLGEYAWKDILGLLGIPIEKWPKDYESQIQQIISKGLGLGISKFVMVDPFHRDKEYETLRKEKEFNPDLKLELSSLDGLTFLNNQDDGSGNMMTNNMDYTIISSEKYLKRLAEEAFRVVPEEGIYISCNSDTEDYASRLFPQVKEFGIVKVFEK